MICDNYFLDSLCYIFLKLSKSNEMKQNIYIIYILYSHNFAYIWIYLLISCIYFNFKANTFSQTIIMFLGLHTLNFKRSESFERLS